MVIIKLAILVILIVSINTLMLWFYTKGLVKELSVMEKRIEQKILIYNDLTKKNT